MSHHTIKADRTDHQYFTMTPHIILALCRDSYDLAVWTAVKTIAGENGECILATDDLAALAKCSHGKLSNARAYLIATGLLSGELRRDPGYPQPVWHLSVPDLWPRNMAWRQDIGPSWRDYIEAVIAIEKNRHVVTAIEKEPSPHDGGGSPGDGGGSPGDLIKKVQITQKPYIELNNNTPEEVWTHTLDQLRLQMTKGTFVTWLQNTTCIAYEDYAFVIQVTNIYARDWLTLRLQPMIKRTLHSITQHAVDISFVVKPATPTLERE